MPNLRESGQAIRELPTEGMVTGQVSIAVTPTLIAAQRLGRRGLAVINHGTTDVFLGDSGVSAATGLLLAGSKGAAVTVAFDGAVYGITAGGAQTISFMELF